MPPSATPRASTTPRPRTQRRSTPAPPDARCGPHARPAPPLHAAPGSGTMARASAGMLDVLSVLPPPAVGLVPAVGLRHYRAVSLSPPHEQANHVAPPHARGHRYDEHEHVMQRESQCGHAASDL